MSGGTDPRTNGSVMASESWVLASAERSPDLMSPLMEESVVTLNYSSMRPDIEEAKRAPVKVKEKLVYRDSDELDTGLQKVQPLPFLDEEIERFRAQIERSVPAAQAVKDTVPADVLGKVQLVIQTAHQGQTSLFKASQLLEFTSSAYDYARSASQDTFDLRRESAVALKHYDETVKRLIECRIKADMRRAESEQDQCFAYLSTAVEAAKKDVQSQQQRAQEEDSKIPEADLVDIHAQVCDMIELEKSELVMIRDQCSDDIDSIDKELKQLHSYMESAKADYTVEEQKRNKRLDGNRQRQRELRAELERLEKEEESLVKESQDGKRLQKDADKAESDAVQDIRAWRGRIEELKNRTKTSLQVMGHMAECTDWVMKDAKSQKQRWKQRLCELEVESLLTLRDSLMASGVAYLMVIRDSETNKTDIKRFLAEKEKEKQQAAQSGFGMRVSELDNAIQQYKAEEVKFEEKISDNRNLLERMEAELEEVDKRIRSLRPQLQLDTLENRFSQRKRKREQAFQKRDVSDIEFCSSTKYGSE